MDVLAIYSRSCRTKTSENVFGTVQLHCSQKKNIGKKAFGKKS